MVLIWIGIAVGILIGVVLLRKIIKSGKYERFSINANCKRCGYPTNGMSCQRCGESQRKTR